MAATPTTTSEFLELLGKSGLLTDDELQELIDLPSEPTACAAALISKGVITKFQAKLLLNGRYKGFKLGPYIIREQIGQGGMGAVFSAEHETLRRKVALKVLTLPKDGNAELSVERFLREARSAAALDHPNIVRLHDVGKAGDTHYLVMEYVEGQTLDQIITRGGSISSSRAVEYIAQAAAGLQHSYEKGFIHRDIKPGNLILAKDGTVKILDMGLARAMETTEADKLTEILDKGAIVGTADFISPEQAMNTKLDIRSDIYSLGATFFALVTGHAPFTGNTTQKLIQHQMKEAPTVNTLDKTFPAGLSAIVAKMLAKKPENRFQTPADIIHALAEWIPQQASGKMSAAISGTDLATSQEMQSTLSEIASGGTKRLASKPRLNPDTPPQRSQWFWAAVAAGILFGAGGITAGILSALPDESPKEQVSTVANIDVKPFVAPVVPKKAPATKTETKPAPAPKKETQPIAVATPVTKLPAAIYRLDLTGQKPFAERGHMVAPPGAVWARATKKWAVDEKTGEGTYPAGWSGGAHGAEGTIVEFASRSVDGKPALGARNLDGTGGAMLMTPKFDAPTGKIIISFECMVEASGANMKVRWLQQKPAKKQAWDIASSPTTAAAGEWKTITKEIDLKGGTGGFLEFQPGGKGREFVWIRNFSIRSAGLDTDRPDRNAPIYAVSFAKMTPARLKPELSDRSFGRNNVDGEVLPGFVSINQHRPNILTEYAISDLDGVRALGLQLHEGEHGCQIQSGCGDAFSILKPGESLKTRIVYRFDGTGQGRTSIQINKSPYPKFSETELVPTNGQWKSLDFNFTRPDGNDVTFDLIVNCSGQKGGIGRAQGMIYIKSIEVYYPDAVLK